MATSNPTTKQFLNISVELSFWCDQWDMNVYTMFVASNIYNNVTLSPKQAKRSSKFFFSLSLCIFMTSVWSNVWSTICKTSFHEVGPQKLRNQRSRWTFTEILSIWVTRVAYLYYVVCKALFLFLPGKIVNYRIEPTCQTHGRTRRFNLCFSKTHMHAKFAKRKRNC